MRRKQTEQFTGLTLEQWLSDVSNITWAQQEPRFKMMMSVLLNELPNVKIDSASSEGCRLGNVQGYLKALEVFRKLGQRPERKSREPEATFDEPLPNAMQTSEPLD